MYKFNDKQKSRIRGIISEKKESGEKKSRP